MALSRKVIAMAAMTMLLLPILCHANSPPSTSLLQATQPADSCHESAPAAPESPAPQPRCCAASHQPEALLNSAQVVDQVGADAGLIFDSPFASKSLPAHSARITRLIDDQPCSPPLRI